MVHKSGQENQVVIFNKRLAIASPRRVSGILGNRATACYKFRRDVYRLSAHNVVVFAKFIFLVINQHFDFGVSKGFISFPNPFVSFCALHKRALFPAKAFNSFAA